VSVLVKRQVHGSSIRVKGRRYLLPERFVKKLSDGQAVWVDVEHAQAGAPSEKVSVYWPRSDDWAAYAVLESSTPPVPVPTTFVERLRARRNAGSSGRRPGRS
jgi:hypothetical protein